MAFQMLYNTDIKLAGVFCLCGFMMLNNGFTPEDLAPKKILYGLDDKARPWKLNAICYEGKFKPEEIVLVEGMKHDYKHPRVRQ